MSVARSSLFLSLLVVDCPKRKPRTKATPYPPLALHLVRAVQLRALCVCHVRLRSFLMLVAQPYAKTFWRDRRQKIGDIAALIRRLLVQRLLWPVISTFLRRLITPPRQPSLSSVRHEFMSELVRIRGAEAMDESAASRPRRPESITVDHILMSGSHSPMRPPPAGRIPGSPTTRSSYESVQAGLNQLPSRSRSESLADVAQQGKRLSLSFPVNGPTSRPSRPPSWANSPIVLPESSTSPTEGAGFLTVLAAQERRVLELKEELRQAEQELEKLKRHWASNESTKKRNDVRRVQQLQPLNANLSLLDTTEEDVDGSSQWMQREMERRKTILSGVKTSNRKVFSGSRHTRTLSLLSPEKTTFSQQFPSARSSNETSRRPRPLTRSSTTSDIAASVAIPDDDGIPQVDGAAMPKDALLRTGKQMASDIKEGLMTFFEDIRQATVGEEAVNGTLPRNTQPRSVSRSTSRASTAGSRRGGGRQGHTRSQTASAAPTRRDGRHDTFIDVGGSFWREHGVESPVVRPTKSSKQPKELGSPLKSTDNDDDAWDMWGTPIKQTDSSRSSNSGSSVDSDHPDTPSDTHDTPLTRKDRFPTAPSTEQSLHPQSYSTRAPTFTDGRRNSIPWPALVKLSPGNLKRTASHLMSEWEKSLAPTPPGEHDSDSGLDYPISPPMHSSAKFKKAD
jgi:hypothetical protein